jgi:hypothetical protein
MAWSVNGTLSDKLGWDRESAAARADAATVIGGHRRIGPPAAAGWRPFRYQLSLSRNSFKMPMAVAAIASSTARRRLPLWKPDAHLAVLWKKKPASRAGRVSRMAGQSHCGLGCIQSLFLK